MLATSSYTFRTIRKGFIEMKAHWVKEDQSLVVELRGHSHQIAEKNR